VALIILPTSTGYLKRKKIVHQKNLEKAITKLPGSGFLFNSRNCLCNNYLQFAV